MGGYRQCSTKIFSRFFSFRAKIGHFEPQNWDFPSPVHAKNDENLLGYYSLESVQTYLARKSNMGGYRQCSTKIFSRFSCFRPKIDHFESQNRDFSSPAHAKIDGNLLGCYFMESVQTYLAIKYNMGGYRPCFTQICSRFFYFRPKIGHFCLFLAQNWPKQGLRCKNIYLSVLFQLK